MIRLLFCCCLAALAAPAMGQPPAALTSLFADWRRFEQPPLLAGAPDYSHAAFARRQPVLSGSYTTYQQFAGTYYTAVSPGRQPSLLPSKTASLIGLSDDTSAAGAETHK